MSFNFSKSKFVSVHTRCNKYAWLEKYRSEYKAPITEFTKSLFDNGHKVGELAKKRYNAVVDVSVFKENGAPDISAMLIETDKHINAGTRVIAEASFSYNGFFCSVDILERNEDGSYNIYEVKSSKISPIKEKDRDGVQEKYIIDAAYQQYVLEKSGYKISKVSVVLLSNTYVRGKELELKDYFEPVDVTRFTTAKQSEIEDKLKELEPILNSEDEPISNFTAKCKDCDYFGFCTRNVPSPSPLDIYDLNFSTRCDLYKAGVSFFDVPKHANVCNAAMKQIEYYNRPNDFYVDKVEIKKFLDSLTFPLYSLDFETYMAVVPEYEEMKANEVIPFQYSLHILNVPDGDYTDGSPDITERHFIDVSGGDPRRAIAESLVENIPYGACVIACHKSTESGIIEKLASKFKDLSSHLLSFTYVDPQPLFQSGFYYMKSMGNNFSLKSISPALYPDDPKMNYHNLEGSVKNGTEAMSAILKINDVSEEERRRIEKDLVDYCALDTLAVVKILKRLYDVSR